MNDSTTQNGAPPPDHPPGHGAPEADQLDRLISRVGTNLRWRRALEGLAWCAGASLVALLAAVAFADAAQFEAERVQSTRTALYIITGVLFAGLVLARIVARRSRRSLVMYLEQVAPDFDALLLSALEARDRARGSRQSTQIESPELDAALMAQAVERCRDQGLDRSLESPRVRRAIWVVVSVASLSLALGALGPETLRHGFKLLLLPKASASLDNPYAVRVLPGHVRLPYGSDLRISAQGAGFEPQNLELYYRTKDMSQWQGIPMRPASWPAPTSSPTHEASNGFEHFIFDIEHSAEYYVRSSELRSPVYEIAVLPRPSIERFDVTYHYPDTTGLAPDTVVDARAISAVKETRAHVAVHPAQTTADFIGDQTPRAQIVIDDREVVALKLADGKLNGELRLRRSGRFRIEMALGEGEMYPVTAELPLEALADGLPMVSFARPGGDAQVTSIEELEIEVSASDDLGVQELEIILSVNGEEDQVVPLDTASATAREFTRSHRLYLEDLSLSPGDLVAYHARARDQAGASHRAVSTDMFFLEVRPFDNEYREAGGGGGGQGGGGQGNGDNLAAQQKELVVALFKLVRDQASLDGDEIRDRSNSLAEAQNRIRSRTDAISRRMGARTLIELNDGYQQMARELPLASAAMLEVQATLTVLEGDRALHPARKALLHLQRAFAAFREVQVARQGRQGSGRARSNANDLANLFKLEMDRFRSQYDHVQRGSQSNQAQPLDAVMERLRKLAERQQREVERASARAGRGMGGAQSQRELIAELEQAVRELKRLTRKRPDEQLESALRDLEAARNAMDSSAQNASRERSQQALDKLREARRQLGERGSDSLADNIGQSLSEATRLLNEQRAIRERVRRLDQQAQASPKGTESDAANGEDASTASREEPDQGGPGQAGTKQIKALLEQKKTMVSDLRALSAQLERLSRESQQRQSQARQGLAEAKDEIRDGRLTEQIEESRARLAQGNPDPESLAEGAIERGLSEVRQAVARASRAANQGSGEGQPGEEPPAAELNAQVRELMRSLANLTRQTRDAGSTGERAPAGGAGQGGGGADRRAYAADIRQGIRRQGRNLERIRTAMIRDGHSAQDISALLEALDEFADRDDTWADGERLSALGEDLLRRLQRMELTSRGSSSDASAAGQIAADPDLPRTGEERVAYDYYRQLSEGQ